MVSMGPSGNNLKIRFPQEYFHRKPYLRCAAPYFLIISCEKRRLPVKIPAIK
jgi:hypothetical protein